MASSPIYNWPEPDDTSLVKNGALAMRTLGNAIDTTMATMVPKSIVDAKGDLIGATANDTPARLAVGTNGQVLTADSTAATGLAWATPAAGSNTFYAGKNKVINGDFFVNQRAFTSTTASGYTFDRWRHGAAGGTVTTTAQTFTAGTAPVAGYEGKNFIQQATTGQSAAGDYSFIGQGIEGVRTFAGQTVTVSFWAKASTGTPKVGITLRQVFGTGGSTTVSTADAGQTITTSWVRYSSTITLPSISGKTIAGGDDLLDLLINTSTGSTLAALGWSNIGIQNSTIAVWGLQVEAGSSATSFTTASGSIGGELALCQRYYHRFNFNSGSYSRAGFGTASSTTNAKIFIPFNTTMRITPTAVDYSTLGLFDSVNTYTITSVALDQLGPENGTIDCAVASGLTQFRPYFLYYGNTTGAYVGFSAEL
jgi:hypothetical protein